MSVLAATSWDGRQPRCRRDDERPRAAGESVPAALLAARPPNSDFLA